MLTVDVKAIQDGQTFMAHYKGDQAFRDAINQAREWGETGYQDVQIDSSRPMTMLEFAMSFTIVYVDPETGLPHHERWADHIAFVERQDADRVWSVVERLDGLGTDLAIGYFPSNERYVVTEEPWIMGINTIDHSVRPDSSFKHDADVLASSSNVDSHQSPSLRG